MYPDAQDVPGKQVMVKVDSGPWQIFIALIVYAQNLGFNIYPESPTWLRSHKRPIATTVRSRIHSVETSSESLTHKLPRANLLILQVGLLSFLSLVVIQIMCQCTLLRTVHSRTASTRLNVFELEQRSEQPHQLWLALRTSKSAVK